DRSATIGMSWIQRCKDYRSCYCQFGFYGKQVFHLLIFHWCSPDSNCKSFQASVLNSVLSIKIRGWKVAIVLVLNEKWVIKCKFLRATSKLSLKNNCEGVSPNRMIFFG